MLERLKILPGMKQEKSHGNSRVRIYSCHVGLTIRHEESTDVLEGH
jgi:hypothetical protein